MTDGEGNAKHRIIPMRVGTRCRRRRVYNMGEDHPHACGDKVLLSRLKSNGIGSSPCVWGQGCAITPEEQEYRIIPMRVGTSRIKVVFTAVYQDHPHACGDKFAICVENFKMPGSSPCVWGQEAFEGLFAKRERIIPMRVGTSMQIW